MNPKSPSLNHQEIVSQYGHEKQEKLIGRTRHIPGLKFYEMDTETFIIRDAEIEAILKTDFDTDKNGKNAGVVSGKIVMKINHIYCQALNPKNAARKFAKRLGLKTVNNGADNQTNSRD